VATPSSSPPPPRRFALVRVFTAYAAVTIALTYPLITRMTDGVPSDLGDPLLVSWILWWNAHAVPFSQAFWNAPAFFPAQGVLAFSETFAGLSPVSTPIYWLTGNIQLGYNVCFLLTFLLSAFFGYLLCRELSGREDAAFVGGLIFGFAPYRIDQLPHMQMLVSFWMPLGLFGLHRYLRTRGTRWLVLFGIAWLMQGLSSGYLMMFFSILVGSWLCWFLPWREWRLWLKIGAAWGLAMLPMALVLLEYRHIHEMYGFRRSLDEIRGYSADITGVLQAPARLLVWGWLNVYPHAEGAIFPGVTAILIILVALVVVRTRAPRVELARGMRRLRTTCGVAALVFGAAALSAWLVPWQLGPLLSNTHVDKPLRFGALSLSAWVATSPALVGAFRRHSVFGFYLVATVLMWLLSLGPSPTFFGDKTPFTGPYAFLLNLPGFDSLRVPGRFAMATALCLACAGALAFGRLASKASRPMRIMLTVTAIVTALADVWTAGFVVETRPAAWPIQTLEAHEPVIELPLGDQWRDIGVMYRAIHTGNPIVNGFSGYFPPWYAPLASGLQRHDPTLLEDLSALGVRQVVLDTGVEDDRAWQSYFETRSDIVLVGTEGNHRLYRLPPADRMTAPRPHGGALHVEEFETNVNPQLIPALTDGDLHTRWQTGPQKGIEHLTLDLGAVQPVGAVELSMGEFTTDAPRDLLVEASDDGRDWTTVWRGHGEREIFLSVLRDPKRVPLVIDLGDRRTRFIRLSQLGQDPVWYWSIAECAMFAPATAGGGR